MNIKKNFVEVIAFLEANQDKKIKTVLDEVKALCSAKSSGGSEIGTTFLKDEEGHTVAVFCYYFKKWMPLGQVEFGQKAGTASGFNTMCKEGVSNWTKQQRMASQEKEALLSQLSEGSITVEDLPRLQAEIEERRKVIVEAKDSTYHFESAEKVLAFIAETDNGLV
jgi:hypothetical protein